jgi:hypothetical protein
LAELAAHPKRFLMSIRRCLMAFERDILHLALIAKEIVFACRNDRSRFPWSRSAIPPSKGYTSGDVG